MMRKFLYLLAAAVVALSTSAGDFSRRAPESLSPSGTSRPDRPRTDLGAPTSGIISTKMARKAVTAPGAMPPMKTSASAPSLCGLMIYSADWQGTNATGFYSIDATTGAPTLIRATPELSGRGTVAGILLDDVFYATYLDDFFGQIKTLQNITVDLATGKTKKEDVASPSYSLASVNMTYDASTHTVYSINYSGNSTDYYDLCTFDPQTFTFSVVASLSNHYYAFCSDSRGSLYAINDAGEVVQIDAATGIETRIVAKTNIEPAYQQSCCWSPRDNKIYWAACNNTTAALVTIDPVTGVVATATRFPGEESYVALTCTDPAQNPAAPAAPGDLAVSFNEPGGFTAHISCTAPTLSIAGAQLDRELTLSLSVDGKVVNSAQLMPGVQYSFVQPLTQGVHQIRAVCSNDWGEGVAARAAAFAGVDRPADISDLAAEVQGTNTVSLTWSAPTMGAEGGWFDPEQLSYNVVRDGVTVASGIKDTTFTDTLPETFATSVYSIEVCYGGTAVAGSNEVSVATGSYLALPYSNDFEQPSDFLLMTVIDNNGDGNTWFFDEEYNTASYNYSRTAGANDFLFLPCIKGEKGHIYRLKFFARSASASYPEKMAVYAGNAPQVDALTEQLLDPKIVSNAGETITVETEATADGPLYFAIQCVSDPDMSRLFVDDITVSDAGLLDAPAPATDLTIEPSATGALSATITFNAPNETLGGEPLTSLDRLELLRNGEVIYTFPSPVCGMQYSYTYTDAPFGFNEYAVNGVTGGLGGNMATARAFIGVYSLPFAIGPTAEEYELFTIPGGETDHSWYYDQSESALKIITYWSAGTDAWIFTPGIELDEDYLVDLTFDCRAGLASCTEKLEVTIGSAPVRELQSSLGEFTFNNTEYTTRHLTFEVMKADPAKQFIGFHCTSDPGQMMALVRNIRLTRGARMTAPGYPAGVEVRGVNSSELKAEVSFTLPTLTLGGEKLTGNLSANIYNEEGTQCGSVSNLAPGAKVTVTVPAAVNGINEYSVAAVNASGEGGRSLGAGWVGVDVPGNIPMLDITPSFDNLKAELEWEAPEFSLHGGFMDTSALRYNIYQLIDNSLYLLETTTYCQATVTPQGGDVQDFFTFYVTAVTDAGESTAVSNGVVLGPPYLLPMTETASNKVITALPWIAGSLEGDVNWGVADYIGSLDLAAADGGMFVCSAALPDRNPGVARMQLPKLCFDGLNAPTLTFRMYHYAATGAELHVQVTTDEVEYTDVFSTTTNAKAEGWTEYSVNLAQFADAHWVAIVFDGQLANGASYIIVDDIEVANRSERDLMVARVGGRTTVAAGEEQTYTVDVRNAGKTALAFDLEMRVNGERHLLAAHDEEIPAGTTATVPLTFTAKPEHIGAPLDVEIEILPRDWTDEIPSNNVARFSLTAVQPELPVVTDLKAARNEAGEVNLSWSAPSLVPDAFTDNFTDYESFAYENIGDYITVDLDELIPCGISGVKFPNMGTPMAFQIWEPKAEGVDVDAEIWQPHTGNKCLIAWTALSSYVEPFNDDWFISPELYAAADAPQTISFFVRRPVGTYGAENYEILYSMSGTDIADFTLLKAETVSNGSWNERSYTLPAGARHFAIRYTSRNKFALLFDDLTYIPASENGDLTINGFSLYRNGAKIADADASARSYTDAGAADGTRYNVTVAYDRGTSILSNTAQIGASGIEGVSAAGALRVSGHAGYILVEGAEGAGVRVADTAGRTVYATAAAGSSDRIFLPAGVYMVTVGDSTVKVAVR